MKKTTKHCYILNLLTLGLMVSEKKIFEGSLATWFNIKYGPWSVASLDTRGLIGRI